MVTAATTTAPTTTTKDTTLDMRNLALAMPGPSSATADFGAWKVVPRKTKKKADRSRIERAENKQEQNMEERSRLRAGSHTAKELDKKQQPTPKTHSGECSRSERAITTALPNRAAQTGGSCSKPRAETSKGNAGPSQKSPMKKPAQSIPTPHPNQRVGGPRGSRGKKNKRSRPDDSFSPNTENKRPKPDLSRRREGVNYRDATTSHLAVAVVLQPFREMTQEEGETIRKAIEGRIFADIAAAVAANESPQNAGLPVFLGKSFVAEGALKMWCENDRTLLWLTKNLRRIESPRQGLHLTVIPQSELEPRVRCGLKVPGYGGEMGHLQSILGYQNPQYDVASWSLYGCSEDPEEENTYFLNIGIPRSQIPTILAQERRVNYSTGSIYIRFFTENGLSETPPPPPPTTNQPTTNQQTTNQPTTTDSTMATTTKDKDTGPTTAKPAEAPPKTTPAIWEEHLLGDDEMTTEEDESADKLSTSSISSPDRS